MNTLFELEDVTAENWTKRGIIWETDAGKENTYYTYEFDYQYFCKII